MRNKKRWIIIVIAFVLLFPRKYYLKDGGSIVYQSFIYSFEKVNSLKVNGVEKGYRLEILGIEVFKSTVVDLYD